MTVHEPATPPSPEAAQDSCALPDLATLQADVTTLYTELDEEIHEHTTRRAQALRAPTTGDDPEAKRYRDVLVATTGRRLTELTTAEHSLVFGRIDHTDGEKFYIGRAGLSDDKGTDLLDWRAPAARGFYCATAVDPLGLRSRSHLKVSKRRVVAATDDVFDGTAGISALLEAVDAPRSERMQDIAATIQKEQDDVIRAPLAGLLVVDGGPGTGKTAVALHRAAYLLYSYREVLQRRGVLVVGPNRGFLDYVADVLPSLGETSIAMRGVGELFPGVATETVDSPAATTIKGSARMVEALAAAIDDRQELPEDPLPVSLDGVTVYVDHDLATRARDRARATGLRHNLARPTFVKKLINELTDRAVAAIGENIGADVLEPQDIIEINAELADSRDLRSVLRKLWPDLTPRILLRDLYASDERLAAAGFSPAEAAALRRDGRMWTVADVALLDEAAELLGAPVVAETKERGVDYASELLEIMDYEAADDDSDMRAVDFISAETIAERQRTRDDRGVDERSANDREWSFGHVIVDEAQELSEMDWRMVLRRVPSKSMTVVGDLAQTASPAGAREWSGRFGPLVDDRWAHRTLTVNYRTPAEIMEVATRLLPPAAPRPESVRRTGNPPWTRRVDDLGEAVEEALDALPSGGTHAVVSAVDVPGVETLHPLQVKGLEFDHVLLVEPSAVTATNELYVALTRATQTLGILHTRELPAALAAKS